MDQIENFVNLVFKERISLWAVAAIVFILIGLQIRSLALKPLIRRAKELNIKDHKQIKGLYLRRSIWGWLCFALSMVFAVTLWENPVTLPLEWMELQLVLGLVISFLCSIILHVIAFGRAALVVLNSHKDLFRP